MWRVRNEIKISQSIKMLRLDIKMIGNIHNEILIIKVYLLKLVFVIFRINHDTVCSKQYSLYSQFADETVLIGENLTQ